MDIYAVVGAGGFGREVVPIVSAMMGTTRKDVFKVIFVDDKLKETFVNGYELLDTGTFLKLEGNKFFNIAIANSKSRQTISEKFISAGAKPFSITAHNTLTLSDIKDNDSAILCPFTTIATNTTIGTFFHANLHSYIGHDCSIGNYVTFAPNVHCNHGVTIQDHAYIGTGAIIDNGTPDRPIIIGEGAIIGMGAVVTKSVPPFTTVFGNPARPLRRIKA